MASADEALLTSTPMCLLPVTRLNGRADRRRAAGPGVLALIAAWSEMVGIDIVGQAERHQFRG